MQQYALRDVPRHVNFMRENEIPFTQMSLRTLNGVERLLIIDNPPDFNKVMEKHSACDDTYWTEIDGVVVAILENDEFSEEEAEERRARRREHDNDNDEDEDEDEEEEEGEGEDMPARIRRERMPGQREESSKDIVFSRTSNHSAIPKKIMQDLIKETLMTVIKERPITVSVPHGAPSDRTDHGFMIHVWAVPTGTNNTERVRIPIKLFGHNVDCRDSIGASDVTDLLDIVDENSGISIAGVSERDLYIYFDAVHVHSDATIKILREIFKRATDILATQLPMLISGAAPTMTEEQMQKSKTAFTKFCQKRIKRSIKSAKEKYTRADSVITNAQRELTKAIRDKQLYHRIMSSLSSDDKELIKKYQEEYEAMMRSPKIEAIRMISDHVVEVHTTTLFVTNPKTKLEHELGKYRLVFNCESSGVSMFNKTRTVSSFNDEKMHAPHVFPGGRPCEGTLATMLPELMANYEFAALISVCIQFLETVNVDDPAGAGIGKWPLSEKGKADKAKRKDSEEEKEKTATRRS